MVGKVGVCTCGSDDLIVYDLPFLASILLSALPSVDVFLSTGFLLHLIMAAMSFEAEAGDGGSCHL